MISSPSTAPSWVAGVHRCTEQLKVALNRHIAEAEGTEGIIKQIKDDAPGLTSHADRLIADHTTLVKMTADVLDLVVGLDDPNPDEADVLRDATLELLGQLSRHRQRGVDLVYDAYDLDIGGRG